MRVESRTAPARPGPGRNSLRRLGRATVGSLIAVVYFGRAGAAQVDVRSSLSADTIGLDESVEYQVSVRGSGISDVEAPELATPPGLSLFGRTQSSEVSITNGTVERRTDFILVYRPYRIGTAVLGPATVRVGKERLTAPPLRVTVVPAGGPVARGAPAASFPPPFTTEEEEPGARPGGLPPIFVTNRLDRDTVFVGEQVVLTFAFYQGSRAMVLDQPNYSSAKTPGFWTQDFNREPDIRRELLDGEPYTIQRFYYGLFPLTAGEKTIAPANLTLTLRDPASFLDRGRTRTLTGDTLHLTVLPLPQEGRPEGFGGAVGRYRIAARVEPREVERDAPVNVTLTVSGEGNVATIPAPRLPETPELKVFDPEVSVRPETDSLRVSGTKRFRYLVVPKRSGVVHLGPVPFSYFDPRDRAYHTTTANLGDLAVRTPAGGVENAEGPGHRALAGIRVGTLDEGPSVPWREPLFWVLATLPLLAFLGGATARGRMPRPRRPSTTRLAAADWLGMDSGPEVVARAERNLEEYLEARYGVPLASRPLSVREASLREAGVPDATTDRAVRAMRALESVAFAPPWARDDALAEARAALEAVEEADRPGRRAAGSRR